MANVPELRYIKDDDAAAYQYRRYRVLKIGRIPSADTIESLEIKTAIIEHSGPQPCEFPRLRTLKLEGTQMHRDWEYCTAKLLAPQLEHLIFIDGDWESFYGGLGPNTGTLFGPFGLRHLSLSGINLGRDITAGKRTQPNLLTLKMMDCTLGKSFLRSLSNVDGISLEIFPVLELIQISTCHWLHEDYGHLQFVSDFAMRRPRTQVIVEV